MPNELSYIDWVYCFSENNYCFSNQDWYYYQNNEQDMENVKKLGNLFNEIKEYADNNGIYPHATPSRVSYTIKYKDKYFIVGAMKSTVPFYYCDYIHKLKYNMYIDYNDILEFNKNKIVRRNG